MGILADPKQILKGTGKKQGPIFASIAKLFNLPGIYLHIPFCKQACHYCNFHFVTSLAQKEKLVQALLKEIVLRKDYAGQEKIETIYFGGGTPSLLTTIEIEKILNTIKAVHQVSDETEITFEVNPDDINEGSLITWKNAGINRLSIGVQSFFDEDLLWMNRAHNSSQAVGSLQSAVGTFPNISIDLIYGTPQMTNEKWEYNVRTAIEMGIPHLSCYALTVEEKTPLHKMIRMDQSPNINADKQSEQFLLLMQWMKDAGYEHYEISNFAKPGWRSKHNTSYWLGEKYIGIGPSAHSFNGKERQWNVSNNNIYITSIEKDEIPFEKELLTPEQRTNEYIMTSLRTKEGMDLVKLDKLNRERITGLSEKYINSGLMKRCENFLVLTDEGKLLADGIASDLFSLSDPGDQNIQ